MLVRLFLCLSLIAFAYGECVIMSVNGTGPMEATGDLRIPKLYGANWTGPIACPEFQNVSSCCNQNLNELQATNFGRLTSAFGNGGGGCDVCAANLIRFFCLYSCSPDQDKFLTFGGYKDVQITNDNNELQTVNATVVNVSANADMACGVYQSCTKVSFMTEISAGSSALGFITFLFDRGTVYSLSKQYVTIVNEGGLEFTNTAPYSCNQTFPNGTDQYGYTIPGNCSCNYCSDSCSPLSLISYGDITDGFQVSHVILTYMFAVLLTVGCIFVKGYRKKRANKIRDRNMINNNSENSGYVSMR